VQIEVWNNGLHSDFTFPADFLPAGHPLRGVDPGARYLLVGWGDEEYFRSAGTDVLLGLKTLLPGGATTVHLVAGDHPISTFYGYKTLTPIALSRAGGAALARRLALSLRLDAAGRAQIIAPGHGGPRSWFLKGRGEFDLFQTCNQWTARVLRAAGVDINAAFLYTGDMLVSALKSVPHECPAVRASGAKR
jgi:hypothetical protein